MVFSIAIKKVSRGQKINQRLSLKRLRLHTYQGNQFHRSNLIKRNWLR